MIRRDLELSVAQIYGQLSKFKRTNLEKDL